MATIESGVAVFVEAREIILEFQGFIHRKALAELDTWISRARGSLVAAFANGVSKDKAAIEAAIALSWPNGQTEGQICELKLVKRQMYGRGNLDLLQAKNCVRPPQQAPYSMKNDTHVAAVRPAAAGTQNAAAQDSGVSPEISFHAMPRLQHFLRPASRPTRTARFHTDAMAMWRTVAAI